MQEYRGTGERGVEQKKRDHGSTGQKAAQISAGFRGFNAAVCNGMKLLICSRCLTPLTGEGRKFGIERLSQTLLPAEMMLQKSDGLSHSSCFGHGVSIVAGSLLAERVKGSLKA